MGYIRTHLYSVLELGRLSQKDQKFQVTLGHTVRLYLKEAKTKKHYWGPRVARETKNVNHAVVSPQ